MVVALRVDRSAAAAWAVSLVLVLYLGLSGGGYDVLVWSEIGVVIWWILLLGALTGLARLTRLGRPAAVTVGALVAFTAWMALGIGWAESSERAATELARVATYLGVFLLALSVARAGYGRQLLAGSTTAIVLIGVVALLSRLHPDWFSPSEGAELLGDAQRRLDYPLTYFNALAALLALGLTLLVSFASGARTLIARAVAAAAVPPLALALFFTISRGGALAAVVGLLVLIVLGPERLPKLASLLAAGAGSAILIATASDRSALEAGLRDATARRQGDELLALVALVCVGVALVQTGIGIAQRRGWRLPRPRASARQRLVLLGTVAVLGVALFTSLGGPGELSDRWREFRQPVDVRAEGGEGFGYKRSVSARGRYQFWKSAVDANRTAPWHGIGPGGFEFWWAREGTLEPFIRDAHSLYLETFAELGIVGLALIAVALGSVLVGGALRAAREPQNRWLTTAATAGCAAFSLSAAIEWVWEIALLPCLFMMLAAIAVGKGRGERHGALLRPPFARPALTVLSIAALVAIVPPLVSASAIRASEENVAASRLERALAEARTAQRAQPYAATPRLQQALVYERLGSLRKAADTARAATEAESTNWRTWVVLSRLERRRGRPEASQRAYERAKSLNPRSRLFER